MRASRLFYVFALVLSLGAAPAVRAQTVPAITGTPTLDTPTNLLDWEYEFPKEPANLDEPTANRLSDLHGEVFGCDLAITTAGNYHMALKDLMQYYLHVFATDLGVKSWQYTTSPPIGYDAVKSSVTQFGNLASRCRPQIAVAPATELEKLRTPPDDFVAGKIVPVIRNYGNVILVKKGNPKRINSVWDLGRPHVRVATPSPTSEPGSFGNYSGSIYRIAYNQYYAPAGSTDPTYCQLNPRECRDMTPEELFNRIFNETGDQGEDKSDGEHEGRGKWLAGARIHHREVPWSIAYGRADAGLIFYHLAKHAVAMFPDKFEMVPLGGTVEAPAPLPGNNVGVMSMACIKAPEFTPAQIAARDRMAQAYMSTEFDGILATYGLRRPDKFDATRAAFQACK